jgi:hypothetical protein
VEPRVAPLSVGSERAPERPALGEALRATGDALNIVLERVVETTADGRAHPEARLVVDRANARWVLGALRCA